MASELLTAILEKLKEQVQEWMPVIIEKGKELLTDAKDGIIKNVVFGDAFGPRPNIIFVEEEFLKSAKLVDIAKNNIAVGSNEVYVWKQQNDDALYIFLAYGKDKEILPEDKNNYVVIKTDGIATDVNNLFKESELVILK